MADVAAKLHAVEADLVDGLVGPRARDAQRVAERRDAENAAAVGDERIAGELRPGVEHAAVRPWSGDALDAVALARLVRIIRGGDHHAERAAPGPLGCRPVGRAGQRLLHW